jgi:hypothetical protein
LRAQVNIPLFVEKAGRQRLARIEFHVDSGASTTRMDATSAKELLGDAAVPDRTMTQTPNFAGARREETVHPGAIQVRFTNDLAEPPVAVPIDFVVPSDQCPAPSTLLGLDSVVGTFRWTFDGTARRKGDPPFGELLTQDAPDGTFLIEALA